MTPQENLGFARAAMKDADRPATFPGSHRHQQVETLALQRAQAHALVGILEHLIGTPEPELPVYDEHPKMADPIQVTVTLDDKPFAEVKACPTCGLHHGVSQTVDVVKEAIRKHMNALTDALTGAISPEPEKPSVAVKDVGASATKAVEDHNERAAAIRHEYENPKVTLTPTGLFAETGTHTATGVEPEHASATELGRKYAADIATGASEALDADNFAKAAAERCTRMPEGWKCIRPASHEDGCFAWPVSTAAELAKAAELHAEREAGAPGFTVSDEIGHTSSLELGLLTGLIRAQNAVGDAVDAHVEKLLKKAAGDESETEEDVEGEK